MATQMRARPGIGTGRRRFVAMALGLVALGALMAGCWPGDPFEPDLPCDCPNTERIVSSIDWLGDGTPVESIQSLSLGTTTGDGSLVSVGYTEFEDTADATAALESLVGRLDQAALSPEPLQATEDVVVQVDGARTEIYSPFVGSDDDALLHMSIRVTVFAEDSRAAEVLQPFVDALGEID